MLYYEKLWGANVSGWEKKQKKGDENECIWKIRQHHSDKSRLKVNK